MGKIEITRIWKSSNVWIWRGGAQNVYRSSRIQTTVKQVVHISQFPRTRSFLPQFLFVQLTERILWVGREKGQHRICTLGAIVVHTWNYVIRWYESHKLSQFSEAAVFAVWNFIPEYNQGQGQDLITMGANQLLKATS